MTIPSPVGSDSKTVFVSWAHADEGWSQGQADEWASQVAALVGNLRNSGIEADVDLYHMHDADIDWTRFGPNAIEASDHVLVVMSEGWAQRWSGKNHPKVGAGAAAEADTLHGLFNRDQTEWQRRIKIVLLPGVSGALIPAQLERVNRFYVEPDNPDSFEDLVRTLTGQPLHAKPPLGTVPVLPSAALRKEQRPVLDRGLDEMDVRKQLVAEVDRLSKQIERQPHSKRAETWREQRSLIQGTLEAMSGWSSD
ncbi:toll/interleukin-1 receptor domain-containing protein [Knoellia locipacati]|uniref:hypothetical protein n=1 Tax=Knoellia locipacati TaxID=882824 RepID=UPI00384F8C4B